MLPLSAITRDSSGKALVCAFAKGSPGSTLSQPDIPASRSGTQVKSESQVVKTEIRLMTALGILNFIVAFLELCVPSYALRLVRRFGAAQVGSFVVIAFASLALLHLVNPLKFAGP